MQTETAPPPAPRPTTQAQVWAGGLLLLAGLGLVLLGGCFLVGVMFLLRPDPTRAAAELTGAETTLLYCLCGLALGCFAGAVALLALGFRGLWRVLQTRV